MEKVRGEIVVDRANIIRLKSTLISGASTVRYFPIKKKQNLSELVQEKKKSLAAQQNIRWGVNNVSTKQ